MTNPTGRPCTECAGEGYFDHPLGRYENACPACNGSGRAPEIGKPPHFSVDAWLDVVEQYIASDEVELALRLLDSAPAYYRDHLPERALEIRESLNKALFTPVQYAGVYGGLKVDEQEALLGWSHRYEALEREVRKCERPHIMELAPGAYIVPAGLRSKGLTASYEHISLDHPKPEFTMVLRGTQKIFVAFELIEHLADPWEIYRNYLRFNREADVVMLSTPLYTHASVAREWRGKQLGHLRTYSPASFHAIASEMFRGREWTAETSDVIVLCGRK